MGKDNKPRRKPGSGHARAPQTQSLFQSKFGKRVRPKRKRGGASEKKDWEDATCSVCMEFPHSAVLLLCSSYDRGCRPYMCATSRRYSNCLDQYKKAYTKVAPPGEAAELSCPLCRGQVKGWTVVEPARRYLNAKKRTCMEEKCKYVGSYKELRKHVKASHPSGRPREVDPALEEKWKRLERERERSDVISTIVSSTPGAVVLGDYVLEPTHHGFYSDFDSDSGSDDDDGLGLGALGLEEFDFGRSAAGILSRFRLAAGGGDQADGDGFRDRRSTLTSFLDTAHRRSLHRIMLARRRWRTGGGTQRDN